MASLRRASAEERNRRRFVRRRWARRWLTWRYVVAVAVLVAVVGGGVYAVYFSSALSVQGVDVEGLRTIEEDEIVAVADVPTGGPLATVELDAIEFRVRSIVAVRSVTATRRWPDDVLITVVEREPVAVILQGGVLRAVDVEGVIFNEYRRAPVGLPRIETPDALDASDAEVLSEAITVVEALPDSVAPLVDHLELRGIDQIDLVLRDERLVRWGSAEASQEKGEVLLVLLSRRAQVYDVSVPGQPTTSATR